MKFKSKIAPWFHLIVLLIVAATLLPLALGFRYGDRTSIILGLIFLVITVLLVFPIYLGTYYVLEEGFLRVRCGCILNIKIPYGDIRSIYETKSPLASAGLSLDRISVCFRKGEVLISPKDKQGFIRLLKERTGVL